MNTKNYEFTGETMNFIFEDVEYKLNQVRSISPPGSGSIHSRGELGGWIESEDNLSQEGECWIDEDVKCFDGAIVTGEAYVCGNVILCNHAVIDANLVIGGDLIVKGNPSKK